jgi:hypothetical protein
MVEKIIHYEFTRDNLSPFEIAAECAREINSLKHEHECLIERLHKELKTKVAPLQSQLDAIFKGLDEREQCAVACLLIEPRRRAA